MGIIVRNEPLPSIMGEEERTRIKKPGVRTQLWYLVAREFQTYSRDPWFLVLKLGSALFMSCVLSSILMGSCDPQANMRSYTGSLCVIQESLFTGIDVLLFKGIFGRALFDREHRVGTYSVVSYVLSSVLVSIPVLLLTGFVEFIPYGSMVGWKGAFMHFLTFFQTHLNGSAFGLVLGLITGRPDLAAAGIPVFMIPQIYTCGIFRSTSTLPDCVRWFQWCSILKYTYSASLIIEFGDEMPENWTEGEISTFKKNYLELNNIDPEDPWKDFSFYALMPLMVYTILI